MNLFPQKLIAGIKTYFLDFHSALEEFENQFSPTNTGTFPEIHKEE